jgi:biopolymer transport protein ExbB/TolQ
MDNMFASSSLWSVIIKSSLLSKTILLGASVVLILCLFICIYKALVVRDRLRQISSAMLALQNVSSINDIIAMGGSLRGTLPGLIFAKGLKAIKDILHRGDKDRDHISKKEFELVKVSLEQAFDDAMHEESSYVLFLKVSGDVAPLVGLFGTISGLIQAFMAIGREKTTDMATIAPGIAEALITTFAGVVVAILALIMFHYVSARLRDVERNLVALVTRFEWVIQNSMVE